MCRVGTAHEPPYLFVVVYLLLILEFSKIYEWWAVPTLHMNFL
jgi:hypothetical protein